MNVLHAPRRLEIRHTLDADPDTAFAFWREPELVEQWWGPEGYETVVEELDMRTGGSFRFQMTAPSGASCPMSGTYLAVDPPHTLAFVVEQHCVADIPDSVRPPAGPSNVEVRFQARGSQTEIVLVQSGLAMDYQMLAEGGWGNCLVRQATMLIAG